GMWVARKCQEKVSKYQFQNFKFILNIRITKLQAD
uniref:Uncharacterized protein n=1 Tax=Macaca fascicularis TaxID=9541 RepID=A0A7N9CYE3_MACFA